jgi:hypothetical protein
MHMIRVSNRKHQAILQRRYSRGDGSGWGRGGMHHSQFECKAYFDEAAGDSVAQRQAVTRQTLDKLFAFGAWVEVGAQQRHSTLPAQIVVCVHFDNEVPQRDVDRSRHREQSAGDQRQSARSGRGIGGAVQALRGAHHTRAVFERTGKKHTNVLWVTVFFDHSLLRT